jgi:drug/metabolite transporter (DMT)-like permease
VSPLPLALVLLSALAHVYWNLQLKRSAAPDVASWWIMALGALFALPVGVLTARPLHVPAAGWYCVAGTGLIYAAYFSLIALSYRDEDLSRAYPIARGVAPAATALWGVLYHAEQPTPGGWAGIAAISAGVLLLALPGLRRDGRWVRANGILAALGTGLCISGYSAVDKEGVRHVEPVLYIALTFAVGALAQGAVILTYRRPPEFLRESRLQGAALLPPALASLGGYLLVLYAFQSAPVSYVVPIRSVAVLLSVLAGARLLGEKGGPARVAAAALILLGVSLIAALG